MSNPILKIKDLTHDFGPFRAIDNVSLEIERGSITGLIGPNGAGKTTLFNVITGGLKPKLGSITLDDIDVTGSVPESLFLRGLGRTFQIPRPFAKMSVLENVMLAPKGQIGEKLHGPFFSRGFVKNQEIAQRERIY